MVNRRRQRPFARVAGGRFALQDMCAPSIPPFPASILAADSGTRSSYVKRHGTPQPFTVPVPPGFEALAQSLNCNHVPFSEEPVWPHRIICHAGGCVPAIANHSVLLVSNKDHSTHRPWIETIEEPSGELPEGHTQVRDAFRVQPQGIGFNDLTWLLLECHANVTHVWQSTQDGQFMQIRDPIFMRGYVAFGVYHSGELVLSRQNESQNHSRPVKAVAFWHPKNSLVKVLLQNKDCDWCTHELMAKSQKLSNEGWHGARGFSALLKMRPGYRVYILANECFVGCSRLWGPRCAIEEIGPFQIENSIEQCGRQTLDLDLVVESDDSDEAKDRKLLAFSWA